MPIEAFSTCANPSDTPELKFFSSDDNALAQQLLSERGKDGDLGEKVS